MKIIRLSTRLNSFLTHTRNQEWRQARGKVLVLHVGICEKEATKTFLGSKFWCRYLRQLVEGHRLPFRVGLEDVAKEPLRLPPLSQGHVGLGLKEAIY